MVLVRGFLDSCSRKALREREQRRSLKTGQRSKSSWKRKACEPGPGLVLQLTSTYNICHVSGWLKCAASSPDYPTHMWNCAVCLFSIAWQTRISKQTTLKLFTTQAKLVFLVGFLFLKSSRLSKRLTETWSQMSKSRYIPGIMSCAILAHCKAWEALLTWSFLEHLSEYDWQGKSLHYQFRLTV